MPATEAAHSPTLFDLSLEEMLSMPSRLFRVLYREAAAAAFTPEQVEFLGTVAFKRA
jgi:hypothetical protein